MSILKRLILLCVLSLGTAALSGCGGGDYCPPYPWQWLLPDGEFCYP